MNNIESGNAFCKIKKYIYRTFKRTTYVEKFIKIKKGNSWRQGRKGKRKKYGRPKTD